MSEPEELDDKLPVLVRDATVVPPPESRVSTPGRSRARGSALPAVQAAAAAAGGFVAGAAVLGIVHQRRSRVAGALGKGGRGRSLARRGGRGPSLPAAAEQGLQILSSRTLLLDVHVLGTPDAGG